METGAAGPVVVKSWQLVRAGEPLALGERVVVDVPPGQVLVRVAGCGVCHTDLGFVFDGVRTRSPLPLTLGHEISGVVERAGEGAEAWVGRAVVVPAVIPCGLCADCEAGRGSICAAQIFPGNDVHGGFGSHVLVPARGLCAVEPEGLGRAGLELADLSVLADAVSTAYQAAVHAAIRPGDVAIVVGAGGVGGFAAQIARALGARVVALDIDDARLEPIAWAAHGINVRGLAPKEVREAVRAYARAEWLAERSWKIFEASGTAAGQALAFGLLCPGATLMVVGYTMEPVTVRLSNLMAFDATARGTWGCLPELFPKALELVFSGAVRIAAAVERHPMSRVNDVLADLHEKRLSRRPVLIPDFD